MGAGLALLALLVLGPSAYVALRHRGRVVEPQALPELPVAVVFGASVQGGAPSPMLAQRLDKAVTLLQSGKVSWLLLSGHNEARYYGETPVMRRYAQAQGAPNAALVEDGAGASTLETVQRARQAHAITRAALVTQGYHLPRALYLARAAGIDAWGVRADEGSSMPLSYELREALSRSLAFYTVLFRRRAPLPAGEQATRR
jgi:vancomycin permeability regulator SanA